MLGHLKIICGPFQKSILIPGALYACVNFNETVKVNIIKKIDHKRPAGLN